MATAGALIAIFWTKSRRKVSDAQFVQPLDLNSRVLETRHTDQLVKSGG